MTLRFCDRLAPLAAAGAVALVVSPAFGQILPRRAGAKVEAQTPAGGVQAGAAVQPGVVQPGAAAAPGINAPGEARRETRQEARQDRAEARDAANPRPEARDAARGTAAEPRREARQEARDVRDDVRDAGAPRAAAREAARETRQDTRQAIQASRAADLGLWFNARGNQGLIIDDISSNGIFATAGFRAGDQIVSINGRRVTSEPQFVQILTAPDINGPVEIVVLRDGREQVLVLQPAALQQAVVSSDPFYQYGFVIDDSARDRIVIQRVYPRTPAYYAGFRQGDVITTLGGQRITSVDMLTRQLTRADGALDFGVTRNGQTRDIQLDAASTSADGSARTALRPNFDADSSARDAATETRDRTADTRRSAEAPRDADAPRNADRNNADAPRSENNSPVAAPPTNEGGVRDAAPASRPGAGAAATGSAAAAGARGSVNAGASAPATGAPAAGAAAGASTGSAAGGRTGASGPGAGAGAGVNAGATTTPR